MSYMTKQSIVKAYNRGHIEDVAKQLRMYGTITHDKSWNESSGYYAGAHRVLHITQHGYTWEIHMHNGEVKRLGYTL
jgi:hypothetical protein